MCRWSVGNESREAERSRQFVSADTPTAEGRRGWREVAEAVNLDWRTRDTTGMVCVPVCSSVCV